MRAKQLSFFKDPRKNTKRWWIAKQGVYGGSLNYRKVARPFDKKKLSHAVLKGRVAGEVRFTKFEPEVRRLAFEAAARYGVKIKDLAVNTDHIHLLFYTKSREAQASFLRLFAANMGRKFKALRKHFGFAKRPLWIGRPFTRLVSWGRRSVQNVQQYIKRNRREAIGFLDYKPRAHALTTFLNRWSTVGWSSA